MEASDWEQVAQIYLEGIRTGMATFQDTVPTWEEWNGAHLASCRLVIRSGKCILGWTALSPYSNRPVYAGVAGLSIYIAEKCRGLGLGKALLGRLILESERHGFWTLQSRIIRENTASIALHVKCGFREVGYYEKLGKMNDGVWHDVVLMERRSRVVGIG